MEARWHLHEERCLAEHVVLHYDTCKIAENFENEATGHSKGEAMSPTPNPENELSQEEKGKYDCKQEIRPRIWHVVDIGVLERAKLYCTFSDGGDVGCQPESCWIDFAIELSDVDRINLG